MKEFHESFSIDAANERVLEVAAGRKEIFVVSSNNTYDLLDKWFGGTVSFLAKDSVGLRSFMEQLDPHSSFKLNEILSSYSQTEQVLLGAVVSMMSSTTGKPNSLFL